MKKFNLKPTDAQRVFKNQAILNARPEGMSMDEYRAARKLQTKAMRILFPRQFDESIARVMRPKQKSAHQLQQLKNAMFAKYGKDITEEAKENKAVLEPEQSFLSKLAQNIRSVFGKNNREN